MGLVMLGVVWGEFVGSWVGVGLGDWVICILVLFFVCVLL